MTLQDIVQGIGSTISGAAHTIYTTDIADIVVVLLLIAGAFGVLYVYALVVACHENWIRTKIEKNGKVPWYIEDLGYVVVIVFILCMLVYALIVDQLSR